MREYQVRICERLGVKFPGPTRHFEPKARTCYPPPYDSFTPFPDGKIHQIKTVGLCQFET